MTATDAAISILYDEGVRHIFGIPGAGILPFYKSMKNNGKIKHMVARHEEGAIHMADGYARAINTVGVCAATSGPGASNFVTGLYTAQVDSIPVLAITGQNVRAQLGREAFQAVDIAEICKPITKKSYCVKEPAMVPWVFREAFRIMREGRPGPVLIDLPLDVQKGEIVYDPEADGPLAFQPQGRAGHNVEPLPLQFTVGGQHFLAGRLGFETPLHRRDNQACVFIDPGMRIR